MQEKRDINFAQQCIELSALFSHYKAEDVVIALGVSDLWLPNISSPIKHQLALAIFIATSSKSSAADRCIETYQEFQDFIEQVHALMPEFPTLEDYIPETDWGEISFLLNGTILKIFYGNNVERIPDYIEAFLIKYEGQLSAANDMGTALSLQNHLVLQIDKAHIGDASNIQTGHIEVPHQKFWEQCRSALLLADTVLSNANLSSDLILEPSSLQMPSSLEGFNNSVVHGAALAGIAVRINGRLIPLSPRNAAATVIDVWSSKKTAATSGLTNAISKAIVIFLQRRLEKQYLLTGPLQLITRNGRLPYPIAGILKSKNAFQFILMLHEGSLHSLERFEQDLHALLASGVGWGVINDKGKALRFCAPDGSLPDNAHVEIIAVIIRVQTSPFRLSVPKTKAHILFLADFVTVFDAIKDGDELENFWSYMARNASMVLPVFTGISDHFASFRDSHALLVEGATTPTMITLDPHWGSNWRYRELAKFWSISPSSFPDDKATWILDEPNDGTQRLIAKAGNLISWSTNVGDSTLHFLFPFEQHLDADNGQMLETFVHCAADTLSQRKMLLNGVPLFKKKKIVIECFANPQTLVTKDFVKNDLPLLTNWELKKINAGTLATRVKVNTIRLASQLELYEDASFEAECAIEVVKGLAKLTGQALSKKLFTDLTETKHRQPRFMTQRKKRTVDVPDFSEIAIPKSEQYKIARRDLAITLKQLNVTSGKYELTPAKLIIDQARDQFRADLHVKISSLDKNALAIFCIEQHDALLAHYSRESSRIKMSLNHEVSFNRAEAMARLQDSFIKNARNYRYLLESCLSMPANGVNPFSVPAVVQLIANIDWLFVLYEASDVLHNSIDVAGLDISESFVPSVFYSGTGEIWEKEFELEMASAKVGLGLKKDDKVEPSPDNWKEINQAFLQDWGFTLTQLLQASMVLAQWQSVHNRAEYCLSYTASRSAIVSALLNSINDMTSSAAESLIDFLTLRPERIRQLLGRDVAESDVPIWEHNKRGSRYTICPLVSLHENEFIWGAASADKAKDIWLGTISNGYLPAEFEWPTIKKVVRDIKAEIERGLEVRATEICLRATSWVVRGINFKHRFPKEDFEDVGDFDTLAYWPELNTWLIAECKYNKPPFCLKDARRLREEIFGKGGNDQGQFIKIRRRQDFLTSHIEKLRGLLKWPDAKEMSKETVLNVYISRDIYWCMRSPPFEVGTEFIRVDAFDGWLRERALIKLSS